MTQTQLHVVERADFSKARAAAGGVFAIVTCTCETVLQGTEAEISALYTAHRRASLCVAPRGVHRGAELQVKHVPPSAWQKTKQGLARKAAAT